MQRWCSKLRPVAAAVLRQPLPEIQKQQQLLTSLHHLRRHSYTPNFLLNKPLITPSPNLIFNSKNSTTLHSNRLPLSFSQVRNLTLKQRKRKLKSRQPLSPIVSKLKKIKMKSYSSFKGRFRTMKDGQIRRWKEGKRHNAHLKSKIAKRRGRLPALVPAAYAKVMKKLNFCG